MITQPQEVPCAPPHSRQATSCSLAHSRAAHRTGCPPHRTRLPSPPSAQRPAVTHNVERTLDHATKQYLCECETVPSSTEQYLKRHHSKTPHLSARAAHEPAPVVTLGDRGRNKQAMPNERTLLHAPVVCHALQSRDLAR